jgi:hypothetical protein
VGGAVAALGVLATAGWLRVGAQGGSEGILVALALLAGDRHLAGRPRQALALGIGCALVRVEAWPFVAAYALWLWRRDARARPWVALAAAAVPAAWFLPELAGSGDLLRSSERARVIDDPGAPGLAAFPFAASLGAAAALPFLPLAAGWAAALVASARRALAPVALVPLAAGGAWCALVAVMAQTGYSGEARYALPGVAIAAVTAGAGIGWAARTVRDGAGARAAGVLAAAAAVACAPFAVARVAGLGADGRALADGARLNADLRDAIAAAGGRDALVRCGTPYVGPRRGPLLAWWLGVPKRRVEFAPASRGVVFVSSLRENGSPAPAVPGGFTTKARAGRWTIAARCAPPDVAGQRGGRT